jgi:hypothetical protein
VTGKKIKNESAAVDYRLAGIASSLKEYKLCYHLNHLLSCDFRKLKDLVFVPTDRMRTLQFSVFKAGEEEDKNQFLVFSNKNLGEFLLPEISQFDYLLRIEGKFGEDEMKKLLEQIKQLPEVLMVTSIPLKKIKSKERLVYEEEKPSQKLLLARKTDNYESQSK